MERRKHVTIEEELFQLRQQFNDHLLEEKPLLMLAIELGSKEAVRERKDFINLLMEREKDYIKLRKAIIEKTLVAALWAVIVFLVISVGSEVKSILQDWHFTHFK